MPVHDWTRVDDGTFHHFHVHWTARLSDALNDGLLPEGCYAMVEQHAGRMIPDILTLHASIREGSPEPSGGVSVTEAPPRVSRRLMTSPAGLRRTIAVRHVSGHRLVALVEIVSPANKDRLASVRQFTAKAIEALSHDVNVLVIDLIPPGRGDPLGLPGAIWGELSPEDYTLPLDKPLTLAAFVTGPRPEAYLEHLAAGDPLPDMPLFLSAERYINVPLEATYQAAYRGMPAIWRDVLEGGRGADSI